MSKQISTRNIVQPFCGALIVNIIRVHEKVFICTNRLSALVLKISFPLGFTMVIITVVCNSEKAQ